MRQVLKNRKARGRDAGGWQAFCVERGPARAWLRETGSLTARLLVTEVFLPWSSAQA